MNVWLACEPNDQNVMSVTACRRLLSDKEATGRDGRAPFEGSIKMKTLFAMMALVAVSASSLVTLDSAKARGIRAGGPGNISANHIQVGPRATTPVIRPERVGPQQFPQTRINPGRVGPQQFPERQINGPRESGRGVNCGIVGQQFERIHRRHSSQMVTRPVRGTGRMQCPTRI
jgi:hypothetical protein